MHKLQCEDSHPAKIWLGRPVTPADLLGLCFSCLLWKGVSSCEQKCITGYEELIARGTGGTYGCTESIPLDIFTKGETSPGNGTHPSARACTYL